jgi:hypothetical protein
MGNDSENENENESETRGWLDRVAKGGFHAKFPGGGDGAICVGREERLWIKREASSRRTEEMKTMQEARECEVVVKTALCQAQTRTP